MSLSKAFVSELTHEAPATRRMLEILPPDQLGWKPHDKSMTLGRLAGHIAEIPQWGETLHLPALDFSTGDYQPFDPSSVDELLTTFDRQVEAYQNALEGKDDDFFQVTWKLVSGDQVFLEMPRRGVVRSMILNHIYHHRGQLSVCLRLLGVPLPSVYGPTADDQAFG